MISNTDVLIIGAGVAGLYFALNIDPKIKVTIATKEGLGKCNSYLAQGGISTKKDLNDRETYIEDTLRAGEYKNDVEAVKILVDESRENIDELIKFGVPFDRTGDRLDYTREGAHSTFRIVHCKDETGKCVTEALINKVKERENITIVENINVVDLIVKDNQCFGAVGIINNEEIKKFYAKKTVLACGGIGGLFKSSTNERSIKGLSLSLAVRHNIELKDVQYIQFHPTALYEESGDNKKFLLSESLRGEGGKLFNINEESFVDELLPRNVVTKSILEEQKKTKTPYVYLDISSMKKDFIKDRFPGIYSGCIERGVDITEGKIPVTPAQHYFMGGIKVDSYGRTSMKDLFSYGEASCTGVHGANRLASNSLLESLVFTKRGAMYINNSIVKEPNLDVNYINKISNEYDFNKVLQYKDENEVLAIEKIIESRGDLQDELVNYR